MNLLLYRFSLYEFIYPNGLYVCITNKAKKNSDSYTILIFYTKLILYKNL